MTPWNIFGIASILIVLTLLVLIIRKGVKENRFGVGVKPKVQLSRDSNGQPIVIEPVNGRCPVEKDGAYLLCNKNV